MALKNKKILITSGPTWVRIDDVRVISNIATGETGILLAEKLSRLGAWVTLILGQVNAACLPQRIKVIRFKFFSELNEALNKQLRRNKYDIIIHSAAVSDFRPKQPVRGKINSNRARILKLVPLPKIIDSIKSLAPQSFLVMFKLGPGLSDEALIKKAVFSMRSVGADLVVGCGLNPYRAFIIDRAENKFCAKTKKDMVVKLIKNLY
jgi:phosphopantothenoylcysteine synthetase/decarboxylase